MAVYITGSIPYLLFKIDSFGSAFYECYVLQWRSQHKAKIASSRIPQLLLTMILLVDTVDKLAEWLRCWLLSVFERNRADPGSNPSPTITLL